MPPEKKYFAIQSSSLFDCVGKRINHTAIWLLEMMRSSAYLKVVGVKLMGEHVHEKEALGFKPGSNLC